MRSPALFCLAFTIAFSALASAQPQPPPVVIAIDAARPLQQIDGFGSSMVVGFEALERGAFDQFVPAGVACRTTPEQRQGSSHRAPNAWCPVLPYNLAICKRRWMR